MIISAHQPAYNPWLGYFHKVLISDVFVIMDDVQFEKNSFINRNKIFQKPSGTMLTIPCLTKDYKDKSINEIETSNEIWKKKHIKTIQQTYAKSPFYKEVMPLIEDALNQSSTQLIDYTNKLFFSIIKYLNINTRIVFASELNLKAKRLGYIIELTKKLNGNIFFFGKLGEDYADKEILLENGITPYFQNYIHPEYKQNSCEFVPFLGVLDLCFNEKKDNIIQLILKNNINKQQLKALYVRNDFGCSSSS